MYSIAKKKHMMVISTYFLVKKILAFNKLTCAKTDPWNSLKFPHRLIEFRDIMFSGTVMIFVCVDPIHSSQQFFSHVIKRGGLSALNLVEINNNI